MATTPDSQRPAAQVRRPPEAIFKYVVNPLMKTLLRSPLHGRLSERLILLGFTGRKSGKRFATPVGYHWEDGALISFTRRPWAKNMEGGAPVTVWLKGKKRRGTGASTRNSAEILAALDRFAAEHGSREIGMRIGGAQFAGEEPTRAELEAAVQELSLIRIRLEDQA